ncbi:hypothetical protein [Paenisporosarcina sp. TG-14]|uniref:hypothetical protein n=1 Tax=Paenisporosarcina sp. TG-14 TaxID=1231057 RepID=UPI0002FC5290|nr:hypothetical protein [Paenisporosarcina sp. TG-14]
MSLIDKTIQYDDQGRMLYHPKFHKRHGKPFTLEELIYLCKYWEVDDRQSLSFALGKTEGTIASKIHDMKKNGKFEVYKKWVGE